MKHLSFTSFLVASLFLSNLVFADTELSDAQRQLLDTLPPDQQQGVMSKMLQADQLNQELEDIFEEFDTTSERKEKMKMTEEELEKYEEESRNWIFGYEIFQSSPTTFAPATDIPVSGEYILGPGDEVNIQVFGNDNKILSTFINRNGDISIPEFGPINIVGLTLDQAREIINKKVSSQTIGSEVYISLGQLRTISVHVLGEAYQPGSYKISSLSKLSNLLFVSGGVNEIGSVRNIQVKRGGKTVSSFDLYDLLLKGDTSKDITLEQGDTIFIPLIKKTARVYGSFRRPHLYEIKDEDSIENLIFYAGGLDNQVRLGGKLELTRYRMNAVEVNEFVISDSEWLSRPVKDGDTLTARTDSVFYDGVIELSGEFKYPGFYRIKKNEKLSNVISRAGGYTSEAYPLGAVFKRESVALQQKLSFQRSADYLEQTIADALTTGSIKELDADAFIPLSNIITRLRELKPSGRTVVEADLLKIKADANLDFILQGGDTLHVPSRPSQVTIVGEVINPSSLNFRSGKNLKYYIDGVGGFTRLADEKATFLILPNGETRTYSQNRFSRDEIYTIPGTTVVVPRQNRPLDWLLLTQTVTPIFADAATSIATIIALLDDD